MIPFDKMFDRYQLNIKVFQFFLPTSPWVQVKSPPRLVAHFSGQLAHFFRSTRPLFRTTRPLFRTNRPLTRTFRKTYCLCFVTVVFCFLSYVIQALCCLSCAFLLSGVTRKAEIHCHQPKYTCKSRNTPRKCRHTHEITHIQL